MSTTTAPVARRLTVPADRADPREQLVTAWPFWLRDPGAPPASVPMRQVSPPLLSFEGDSFMDDFLASAADRGRFPALLAWRDWCEPPAGLLDAKSAKLYPGSIVRAPPVKIEPESEAPGVLDADGVPHGVPAWLRKLYLSLHLRFHFVAFDLLCLRNGWPPVDKTRVLAAGAVVRRLVRDPSGERWEDWLSADGKIGLWFELKGGLPHDPDKIPSAAYRDSANAPVDALVAARLGLSAPSLATPLSLRLDSAKLTKLPETVAGVGRQCSIYGLLPVFSAAQQVNEDPPGLTEAQLAAAFHDHAQTTLTNAWADDATLRLRLGPAIATLLDNTVLPPLPGVVSTALNNIRQAAALANPLHFPVNAETLDFVATVAASALRRYQRASVPAAGDAGTAASASSFWTNAQINHAAQDVTSGFSGLNATLSSNTDDWNVLVVSHLRDLAASALSATGAPTGDADLARALLAMALVRLRRLRLALLAELHGQAFGSSDAAQLALVRSRTVKAVAYTVPAATAGGLSAEIEALLGVDAVRGSPEVTPSWPPFDLASPYRQMLLHAHQAGLALEGLLGPVDEAGAGGGGAYESRISDRTHTLAGQLRSWFILPASGDPVWRLVETGLDLREQPARGLLVFPGPVPAATVFSSMTSQVAGSYTAGGSDAKAEAKGHARVHRLRYDHDSLYAVWCWARIAGRNDCEKDAIVWTERSEPFLIAEPTDVLGARPVTVQLPDLAKLIRDIPRIAKARAKPFAAFNTPPNSGYNVGDDPKDTSRAWGIGWICSFGIPVITICAFILFSIIFSILIVLPGFGWMLLLKFCIPIPVTKKS